MTPAVEEILECDVDYLADECEESDLGHANQVATLARRRRRGSW
jgi:hypothetical protein